MHVLRCGGDAGAALTTPKAANPTYGLRANQEMREGRRFDQPAVNLRITSSHRQSVLLELVELVELARA